MPTYVAFLRAINLGRTRKFGKDDVQRATEAAGGVDVATYLNTGNVRLTHRARSLARLKAALEASYLAQTGFEVPTVPSISAYAARPRTTHRSPGRSSASTAATASGSGGASYSVT